jgi:nitric oxide reductase NorQ protein
MAHDPNDYLAVGNEEALFTAAWQQKLPVLLKGPTGVGKTRFVEHMAKRLGRPLITVPCHEDLTAADLVGRYLLKGNETVWMDGPLTAAVKQGAICYLDEIVEARSDTVVVLHPLMDHRHELHIDRLGLTEHAAPGFMLVLSYNPGYQTLAKDLKASTRQRMVAIDFGFPPPTVETAVLTELQGIDPATATRLVQFAQAVRRTEHPGMTESVSTRALIAAGLLHKAGIPLREAMVATAAAALSDDPAIVAGLTELIDNYLA